MTSVYPACICAGCGAASYTPLCSDCGAKLHSQDQQPVSDITAWIKVALVIMIICAVIVSASALKLIVIA